MAQAFLTTYNNIYRWHDIDRRISLRPVDKLAEQLPEGDIWLIPKKIGEDDEEGKENLAAAEAAIRKMYRKRLWTTYQVDYCSDMMPKPETENQEGTKSLDNALLSYGKTLYKPKKKMIPPPLPSARRLYGYIRPTNMYVPLTMYQNDYGRVAYHILDSNSRQKQQPGEDVKAKVEENQLMNVTQHQTNESEASSKPKQNGNNKINDVVKKKTKKNGDSSCKCALKSY